MGRTWIRKLGICLADIDREREALSQTIAQISSLSDNVPISLPDELAQEFPKILEQRIGSVPGIKIHLQLQTDTKPVYVREYPVPYALWNTVEEELNRWEKEGIIEPVNTSDWDRPSL